MTINDKIYLDKLFFWLIVKYIHKIKRDVLPITVEEIDVENELEVERNVGISNWIEFSIKIEINKEQIAFTILKTWNFK